MYNYTLIFSVVGELGLVSWGGLLCHNARRAPRIYNDSWPVSLLMWQEALWIVCYSTAVYVRATPQQTQNICITFCTMLDQRRRPWADVEQMLYKCFVFAGSKPKTVTTYFTNKQLLPSGYDVCVSSKHENSSQSWFNYGGPALGQLWFNVSYLLDQFY